MPNTCNNYLTVSTTNNESKEQLKDFVSKCKSANTAFSYEPFYPMPEKLNIEAGTEMEFGLSIIKHRNGDSSDLDKILTYEWCKAKGITTINELEQYLIDSKSANLELGNKAYNNLQEYEAQSWKEWSENNWGVKWDASDVRILEENENEYKVYFYSPWNPPYNFLLKISHDYPDLVFSDDYQIIWTNVITEGLFEIRNGEVIHEDIDQAPFPDEMKSDLVKDYEDGSILYPIDENGNYYPFTIYVKQSQYIIVVCQDYYDLFEGEKGKKILTTTLNKRKAKDKNILKYFPALENTRLRIQIFARIDCNTITEAISKSLLLMNEVREEYNDCIAKHKRGNNANPVDNQDNVLL